MSGLVAGALATLLFWTLMPAAVTPLLLVEHTVATKSEAPSTPASLSRVGWTWWPEHPVRGVERGSHGPLVRYDDGFVALHGSTGEELWTYRLPYARQVKTGVFEGQDRYAYLLHAAEPGPEPKTQTMVVLDTATGQVVRDAPLPPLPGKDEKALSRAHHLTPDMRVLHVYEDEADRVVAHATDSDAPVWEFEWEAIAEDRLCLWDNDGGIRGHGDRVLVSRLCLDRPDVSETELNAALTNMDVPSDAVESVVALDTTTGEQVWRQDWTPDDLRPSSPEVSASREASGGEPVAVTSDGVFALTDGEPVQALPPTPEGATDRTLALDSTGAVVLREDAHDECALLLTNAAGQVVRRRAIEKNLDLWWDLPSVPVLDEALVVPYISYHSDGQRDRALAFMPLWSEEGDEWTPIGFGDEAPAEHVHTFDEDAHQALTVPGAVVSYLPGPDTARLPPAPLYGVVP